MSERLPPAPPASNRMLGHEKIVACRRWFIRVLLCVVAIPTLSDDPVHAQRVYLSKTEIEQTLIGKAMISSNLATGMISRWEFHPDGRVDFVNRSGPGSASGKWIVNADGLMCVTMVLRTRCRYWFRKDGTIANADAKGPDSPTRAEIRLE
ncbi:hypothetical protein [Variovorax sp. YR216]|uniref:hypothetical protein n=1 Tax=Variovorax sp. YR216 TaxID=1882828 RepID=UPI000899283D|nr:hypothetical protein [Variovorax sp. YR216]SEB25769.1 hypothetical protein SAMN05444680_12738 [Variovorax sp. YR216]